MRRALGAPLSWWTAAAILLWPHGFLCYSSAWVVPSASTIIRTSIIPSQSHRHTLVRQRLSGKRTHHDEQTTTATHHHRSCHNKKTPIQFLQHYTQSTLLALALSLAATFTTAPALPAMAADSATIGLCLLQKCQLPLLKCISNPACLANVVCINSCNGKPDETGCQIECGNLLENDVVGEFNKCAVSDMRCVPKKEDDGTYPVPAPEKLVDSFKTSLFNGQWYITAGQNPLFDTFPCQVHFFTETEPGKIFGKLNWRIEEPDGEFFTRDALQRFVQDTAQPGHLINHNNEYLHYEDDWYILDYAYDDNKENVPPFCFVYYRGNNDAWEGYGGAVVYTRASKLPQELLPRLRVAAAKVGMDFDRDFAVTDNTCRPQLPGEEVLLLREKFAGKVAVQTGQEAQALATRLRGNVVNGAKAQKLFVESELDQAKAAFEKLSEQAQEFEQKLVGQ